jgi:hypothetical protein
MKKTDCIKPVSEDTYTYSKLECLWESFWWRVSFGHFRQQLKSGYDYFKLGYKSYDFDSEHALEEFVWKLKRVSKVLQEDELHCGESQKCSKDINKVCELLDRVIGDNYYKDIFEPPITELYGERKYRWDEEKEDNKVSNEWLSYREKQTDLNKLEIDIMESKAYQEADKLQQKEWKQALKIIEKKFFTWWS